MEYTPLLTVVSILFGLFLLFWLVRVGAALSTVFASFMMDMPLIVTIPIFIIFPPAFLFFLIGWFIISSHSGAVTPDSDNHALEEQILTIEAQAENTEHRSSEPLEEKYAPSVARGFFYIVLIIVFTLLVVLGVVKIEV